MPTTPILISAVILKPSGRPPPPPSPFFLQKATAPRRIVLPREARKRNEGRDLRAQLFIALLRNISFGPAFWAA